MCSVVGWCFNVVHVCVMSLGALCEYVVYVHIVVGCCEVGLFVCVVFDVFVCVVV